MNRRQLLIAIAGLPFGAYAQTPAYAPRAKRRLGVIYLPNREVIESIPHNAAPLAALGWIEGQTLDHVKRYAEGDPKMFDFLARQLVAEPVDVLLAAGVPCTRAMQKATKTIPICAIVDDPVGNGFARTMSRPGGNITGLCEGYAESSDKEIELLRAAMPAVEHLAIVSSGYDAAHVRASSQWLIKAATKAGLRVDVLYLPSRKVVDAMFAALPAQKTAIYVRWTGREDTEFLASLASAKRIPIVGQDEDLIEHGAMMTFRPIIAEDRQLASMLDRLLRGGNPAEIPFELPTRSVFAINRKAAAAIGITLPKDFLVRADKII